MSTKIEGDRVFAEIDMQLANDIFARIRQETESPIEGLGVMIAVLYFFKLYCDDDELVYKVGELLKQFETNMTAKEAKHGLQ